MIWVIQGQKVIGTILPRSLIFKYFMNKIQSKKDQHIFTIYVTDKLDKHYNKLE